MTSDLTDYASISKNGSILIGKNTVVDGFDYDRDVGVFTHIHTDHMKHFNTALHECSIIYVSKPTLDLIAAYDDSYDLNTSSAAFFESRHIRAIDWDVPQVPFRDSRRLNNEQIYSDKITIYRSHHILGSSQVLVVTDDQKRVVYSSDFAYPKTSAINCDVLVLDSTHGDPMFNAPVDGPSLENRLVECVKEEIKNGRPISIRAHVGRLQYTMHILSEHLGSNIRFLANHKNIRLSAVYQRYNMPIRELVDSDSLRADQITAGDFPFIEFKTMPEAKSDSELERSAVFQLGGQIMGPRTTIRQNENGSYSIEFGDHSTYDGILDYVRKSSPKLVITDSKRSSWGSRLAEHIKEKLDIDAITNP
ncbi:MAG: hypothetical protein MPK62_02990 [Alphaproteobacteria bacterium]|nr:hypothetical protein [Alphaproteobacteria bacterium]